MNKNNNYRILPLQVRVMCKRKSKILQSKTSFVCAFRPVCVCVCNIRSIRMRSPNLLGLSDVQLASAGPLCPRSE